MRITHQENNLYVGVLDGWSDVLEECQKLPIGHHTSSTSQASPDWYGTKNYDEALRIAERGWPEGINKVTVLSKAITTKMGSMVRKMHLLSDIEGNAFDVGAVIRNEPECWIRPEFKIQKGNSARIIRICMNVATSCGIDADVMIARGSVTSALIKLLEQGGKRVEVWAHWSNEDILVRSRFEFHMRIKRPEQPMDLARIVFAMAHPSMCRRLCFRLYELMSSGFQDKFYGYGTPSAAKYFPEDHQPDILVPHALFGNQAWNNQQASINWIKEELTKQGVKLI